MDTNLNKLAASATLHCLTGCAIGEILGLIIGATYGLSNFMTIILAIGLAFIFGYGLSVMPLIKSGLPLSLSLKTVLAADTLSILTMEIVDNLVVITVPGAMAAGLNDSLFWGSLVLSLAVAFVAAFPVNRYLIARGQGHALTHKYMHHAHNSGEHHEH